MTCDEIDELAGAIALDAIPAEEWPAIEEHLATCRRGHPQIRELRSVATLLLEAAPPIEPPTALRGRILAAARADPGSGGAPVTPLSPPLPPATAPDAAPAVVPLERRRPWWSNAGWIAAAAAVVVAAALGLWSLSLRDDLDQTEQRLAEAQRELNAQQGALAVLTGDGEEFRFAATLPGAGGSVLQQTNGAVTLVVHGLPPADDMTYQVWALRDGRPESLGVFDPVESGRTVVSLDGNLQGVDAVAITLEPGPNGSPGPTSEPVLVAPLAG
ncbi:MAG: anti-sigma factor [Dehalococcoidia bacterium]